MYDITILTDRRYVNPAEINDYISNVLNEDQLLQNALEDLGLQVTRTNWDNTDFNWKETKYVIFRTTWDYFDRFDEFTDWIERVKKVTKFINPLDVVFKNMDKHYLADLENKGINIPPTIFIEKGEHDSLESIVKKSGWKELIFKPVISGAARHTYRFVFNEVVQYESLYRDLIQNESMMLQEFQTNIIPQGEVALMVFDGKFSHAILKKAKVGDFRVQDDFGGTVHPYTPSNTEIAFCEQAIKACDPLPVYARVDIFYDNNDNLCLGELEMIEPELWFRNDPLAANKCAMAIQRFITN
jgi:glutathione synthase/RimK-type ligase-like ATP-grasp enzyme